MEENKTIRIDIDCGYHLGNDKMTLFDHYERRIKNVFLLRSIVKDMILRRNLIEAEKKSCHKGKIVSEYLSYFLETCLVIMLPTSTTEAGSEVR